MYVRVIDIDWRVRVMERERMLCWQEERRLSRSDTQPCVASLRAETLPESTIDIHYCDTGQNILEKIRMFC